MKSLYNITEKTANTTFEQDYIPSMRNGVRQENRSNELQVPKFIVIHEVSLCPDDKGFIMPFEEFIKIWQQANSLRGRFVPIDFDKLDFDGNMVMSIPKSPAKFNLEHYHNKLLEDGINAPGTLKQVGYHYLVTDDKVVQFIPDNEVACHTGSAFNLHSIGIERIICEGTSYPDALHNQAKLAATLMIKHNIPLRRVIRHIDARQLTGGIPKYCPGRLINGFYGGMEKFIEEIVLCIKNRDFFMELLTEDKRLVPEDKQITIYKEKVRKRR